MISKATIREQLDNLPEEFTIDELIERLILVHKIEVAEQESKDGKVTPDKDLDVIMESWFK